MKKKHVMSLSLLQRSLQQKMCSNWYPRCHCIWFSLKVIAVLNGSWETCTNCCKLMESEAYSSLPSLSNHPVVWRAVCVFQLQVGFIYKTRGESPSQMLNRLWRKWIREMDGWLLKGIGVLHEAGLIFPLISTTSNRKVLEPKTLYTEMALPRERKQTTQSNWQCRPLFLRSKSNCE